MDVGEDGVDEDGDEDGDDFECLILWNKRDFDTEQTLVIVKLLLRLKNIYSQNLMYCLYYR